jgi:hypothetical protein
MRIFLALCCCISVLVPRRLVAAIAGTSMMALAFYWSFNTWSNHPACRFLKTTYSAEWHRVARAINVEAANMEKFEARTALGKVTPHGPDTPYHNSSHGDIAHYHRLVDCTVSLVHA